MSAGTVVTDVGLVELRAVATTEDGQMFEFRIDAEGNISRWGNTTDALGSAVEVTERIREAMTL